VGKQPETSRAVAEGRAEDGNLLAVGFERDALRSFAAVALQISAHLHQKLAGGVHTRLQSIGDFAHCVVANPQLIFINERVVDAVNVQAEEFLIVESGLQSLLGDVVPEPQRLKEILIHDISSRADNGVYHVAADHLHKDLF